MEQSALDRAFGIGATTVQPDAPTAGRLADARAIARFILGGNATFTIMSERTGSRFTYKVQAPREAREGQKPIHFVKLLSGPHNESDYVYMGAIFDGLQFRLTSKSRVSDTAPSVRAFAYVWDKVRCGLDTPGVQFYHVGRCGMCGRTLTVPSSIESGIGPECAAKGGM